MKLLFTLLFAASIQFIFAQNQALNFDGTDDAAISNTGSSGSNFNQFTIETWAKLNDQPSDPSDALISVASDNQPILWLWYDRANVQFGTNKLVFGFWNGTTNQNFTFTHDFTPGVWRHLAVVFNGTSSPKKIQLFIDGVLQMTANPTSSPANTSTSSLRVHLGEKIGTIVPGHFLSGALDEVRIWRVARSTSEINTYLNQELEGYEYPLWGYYKINGASCGLYDCPEGDKNLIPKGKNGPQNLPQFVTGPSLTLDFSCLPLSCTAPLKGIYTVGGVSPDFPSIQDAVDSLHQWGAVDTVIFDIRPGTYGVDAMLSSFTFADPAHSLVVFRKQPGTNGIVKLLGGEVMFRIEDSRNYRFENLDFGAPYPVGTGNQFYIRNSSNIIFKNCRFNSDAYSIAISLTDNIDSLSILNCKFTGGIEAVDAQLSAGKLLKNFSAVSDTFYHQEYQSLLLSNTEDCLISKCLFQGDGVFSMALFLANSRRFKVIENRVSDYTQNGIDIYQCQSVGSETSLLANNFIRTNDWALSVWNSKGVNILNNTFIASNEELSTVAHSFTIGQNHKISFKNNIVINDGIGYAITIEGAADTLKLKSDYNVFYSNGPNLISKQSTDYPTLVDWKESTPFDAHSIEINPNITSATDPSPTVYFKDNAGVFTPGIPETTTDYFGTTRHNPPDIGAAEFNPPAVVPMCGEYTVGGVSPNFATISDAIAAIKYHSTACPVRFNIRAGTYSLPKGTALSDITRTNPSDTITFRLDPAAAPTDTAKCSIATAFTIYQTALVRFENLFFCKTTSDQMLRLRGSSHVAFEGCIFEGDAIYADANSDSLHVDACFFHCSEEHPSINLDAKSHSNGALQGVVIENSHFTDDAVQSQGVLKGFLYQKNQFVLSRGTALYATDAGAGDYKILNNRVSIQAGDGIYINGLVSPSSSRTLIANNYIGGPNSSTEGLALTLLNCQRLDIFHNNFSGANASGVIQFSGGSNNRVKNNIIASRANRPAMNLSVSGILLESDFNDLHNRGGNALVKVGNTNHATLAAWQSASGFDAHSKSVLPVFISASNLVPQAAALDGAGSSIAGIPELDFDITGAARISPPDIGAVQFVPGSAQPLCGTYSVGGATPDFVGLDDLSMAIEGLGIGCDVFANVRAGVYPTPFLLNNISKADPNNRLTIRKTPGQGSIVSVSGLVKVESTSRVSFQDLSLANMEVRHSSNIQLRRSIFNTFGGGTSLLCTGNSDSLWVDSCTFLSVADRHIEISGGTANNKPEGVIIENCLFDKPDEMGIYAIGFLNNLIIRKNSFYQDFDDKCLSFSNTEGTIQVDKNRFFGQNNNMTPVTISVSRPALNQRNSITNNFFVNARLEVLGGERMDIVHNNFSGGPRNLTLNYGTHHRLFNNIFHCPNPLASAPVILVSGLSVLDSANYNNIYHGGVFFAQLADVVYTNLAAWQAATGWEADGLTWDPLYVSATDLTPQNAALKDAGTPLSSIPNLDIDISGDTRTLPPDIGAKEFNLLGTPLCGSYTVGGAAPDFATLAQAGLHLSARGTSCNVVFNIRPGTYPDFFEVSAFVKSDPSDRVLYRREGSTGTVLLPNGLGVKNASGVTFQGLKFTHINNGTDVTNANNIVFHQCEFSPTGTFNPVGLEIWGKCDSILVDSCLFIGGNAGLRFNSRTGQNTSGKGAVAKSCSFTNNKTGVQIGSSNTELTAHDNDFQSQTVASVELYSSGGKLSFLRNRIVPSNNGMGFRITPHNGTDSTRLLIANNYIIAQNNYAIWSQGRFVDVFQNNIYSNVTSTNTFYLFYVPSPATQSSNLRLKNNIFSTTSGKMLINLPNSSVIAESDYNNFFNYGSIGSVSNAFAGTLSQWQAATGKDANSLNVHPLFPPTGNELIPDNPLLDSAGTFIPGLAWDVDSSQHSNPPDIGAKSFTPTGNQLCGTYTIGGSNPDFVNFTAAFAALTQIGIKCDVTFHVRPGTYFESPLLGHIPKVYNTSKVSFRRDPATSDTVILQHSTYPLRLDGTDRVSFSQIGFFKSSNTGQDAPSVLLTNTSFVNFDSCTFTFTQQEIARCLQITGGSNHLITHCTFAKGATGVYISGGTETQVVGNQFDNYKYGIYASSIATNLLIKHNLISSTSTLYNYNENIGIYTSITGPVKIIGNRISKTHGTGIWVTIPNSVMPNTVANNFVSMGQRGALGMFIGHNGSPTNLDLIHNTVITSTTTPISTYKYPVYIAASGVRVKNNIFANLTTTTAMQLAYPNLTTSDYNTFYANGQNLVTSNNQSFPTLAAWQSAYSQDAHSIAANPQMSTLDPMVPSNPMLDGAGTSISGIPEILTDLVGTTRQDPPDIGAREMPDTYHNLGITALVSPTSTCNLTGSQTVTVRVKNFGTTPETGFNLGYSVNGGPAINQTFTNSIAPGDSALFSFATPFNFVSAGSYAFKVFSLLPNDFNSANDTLTRTVNSFSLPSLSLAASTYSSCGGATGSLTFAATSGQTPYSFSLGGTGQASGFFGALLPGNYTATVTDANACSASHAASVIQLDIVSPTITGCPANIITQLPCGSSDMPISWTAPTATDDCGLVSFSANQTPGNIFTLGTLPITYSATDISGNTSVCQFTVTIHPAGTKCVWRGGTGSWHDPTKWLCGHVPGACDTAVVSSGNVNVLATAPANVLMLNGGKILGSASLVVGNGLIWSGGTLDVGTTLAAGSANYFTGGSLKLTKNLISSGTVNFSTGTLQIGGGIMFANAGTFRLTGPSVAFQKSGGTPTLPADFANTGLFELSSPNTILTTNFQFSGDGDYALSSGSELRINANFELSGNLHFGTNALVRVQKGTSTFAAIASSSGTSAKFILEGSSIFETTGGLPTFADIELNNPAKWQLNDDFLSTGNLTIKGGTLEGSGSLTLENLNWSGGTLQLPITATANALVNAGFGTGTGTLAAPFVHQGVFNLNSGKLSMKPGGSLTNTGQFFLRAADAAVLRSGSQTTQLFDNQGFFVKTITSGSLLSNITAPFLNDSAGTVLGLGNLKFSALTNHGIFAPGTDTATALLRVQNNWTNGAELKIKIGLDDLGNPVHDKLEVTAKATLNDLLTVEQTADSIPDGSYEILSCGTPTGPNCRTGTFSTAALPPGYTLQYTPKAVFLVKNTTLRPDRAGEKTTPISQVSCSPNPFRNETTVRISLPESNDVSVAIFNGFGEQIAVLQPENWLGVGEHQWIWQPAGLPSGAYFVRVKIGHELQTLPVLLID